MATRTTSPIRTRHLVAQPLWEPKAQAEFLIAALGSVTKLAKTLEVNKSQPSRWKSGLELPGPEATRKLLDLDAIVRRALTLWGREAALVWLESANAHLGHARPIDVAMTRGSSEVIAALDAEAAGSFA